jgi:type IV pilus assembly protein PilY1
MWKFDLRSNNLLGGKLAFSNGQPFFKTPDSKPLTGAPAWRPYKDGILLVAATGQLIDTNDPNNTNTQTIYGVFDKTPFGKDEDSSKFVAPANMGNLQSQTTTTVLTGTNSFASFYKVSTNPVDYNNRAGWYLNMSYEAGQRSISDVLNLNLTVVIASVIPPVPPTTEICTASNLSAGYLYQLDAETGGNPDAGRNRSNSGFDINGDGVGDGVGVAKADGFPRNNPVAADHIGPRTEWFVKERPGQDDPASCTSSSESATILGTNNNGLGLNSGQTCGFQRVWQQLLNPPRIQ